MESEIKALEATKLISDWSKWIVTIETFIIALLGSLFISDIDVSLQTKVFGTIAIISFVFSIASAALLLLSLPEITQTIRPELNIWLTRDSIIGRVFRMNTQGFALVQSFFFGLGVILSSTVVILVIWAS
ncbi:MAG: hypothetical protein AAFV93_07595 [Chloroflexota bacterium]